MARRLGRRVRRTRIYQPIELGNASPPLPPSMFMFMRRRRSCDNGRLGAASKLGKFGDGECDVSDRLDDVKGVLVESARWRLILLEVHPNGSACDAGAREPEDETRAALEEETHALILGDGAVHWVGIGEHVGVLD